MNDSNENIDYVNCLPDEILEYIFSLLPPYKDLEKCKLVCKRWNKCVSNVIQYSRQKMLRSLTNFDMIWENVMPIKNIPSITRRFSHSACIYENSMFVFGGCSCTNTAFNDLWKLDLSTREWHRLLTMGTYPSPKASATLIHYNDSLLLFGGGWSQNSPYSLNPYHQETKMFNELHIYDITMKKWFPVVIPTRHSSPPAMAGHSATMHKNVMVVFGGFLGHSECTNDVWCFDLFTHTWFKPNIEGIKPQDRYFQSQIAVDDDHLLIIGGQDKNYLKLNDVWLLNLVKWKWREVTVYNTEWAARHLWCHPACRVGQYVVVFSRLESFPSHFPYSKWNPKWRNNDNESLNDPLDRDPNIAAGAGRATEKTMRLPTIDRDVNVNGRRGSLRPKSGHDTIKQQKESQPSTSTSKNVQSLTGSNTTNQNINLNSSFKNELSPDTDKSNNSTDKSNPNLSSHRINSDSDSDDSNKINYQRPKMPNKVVCLPNNRRFNQSNNRCMAAFNDSYPRVNSGRQRERQLEALRRIEERMRSKENKRPSTSPSPSNKKESKPSSNVRLSQSKLAMFVLDISTVLCDDCYATWLPVKSVSNSSPEDMIFYSLVLGNGELIMFGGLQRDVMSLAMPPNDPSVLNSLHFITPPNNVI